MDWLRAVRAARRGERDAVVPCGGCTACCTASQFVHIGPDETDTLAHIPAELLFPAPRMPHGHVLMGYDERGQCPMLVDGRCSIYEHRPRTCRTYDCRIFTAAGVSPDRDQALIERRARRWEFSYATEADRTRHLAVRAATDHLRRHADELATHAGTRTPTQLALLAIEVHEEFLGRDEVSGEVRVVEPAPERVRTALAERAGPGRRRRRPARS